MNCEAFRFGTISQVCKVLLPWQRMVTKLLTNEKKQLSNDSQKMQIWPAKPRNQISKDGKKWTFTGSNHEIRKGVLQLSSAFSKPPGFGQPPPPQNLQPSPLKNNTFSSISYSWKSPSLFLPTNNLLSKAALIKRPKIWIVTILSVLFFPSDRVQRLGPSMKHYESLLWEKPPKRSAARKQAVQPRNIPGFHCNLFQLTNAEVGESSSIFLATQWFAKIMHSATVSWTSKGYNEERSRENNN